jgi:hypothetical protein
MIPRINIHHPCAGLSLDVLVRSFLAMRAMARAEESPIAGRTAIRVLKQQKVKEPIFDAASSRTAELFATAIGTPRGTSGRSGFLHGKILESGAHILQHLVAPYDCALFCAHPQSKTIANGSRMAGARIACTGVESERSVQ